MLKKFNIISYKENAMKNYSKLIHLIHWNECIFAFITEFDMKTKCKIWARPNSVAY